MQKLVYTALSKHAAYAKEIVCAHAFNLGAVPLNPFMMFGYFLYDMVDRDAVRAANARVITAADEVWHYGPVSDGGLAEIFQAQNEGKSVRYFTVEKKLELIREITSDALEFESDDLHVAFAAKAAA